MNQGRDNKSKDKVPKIKQTGKSFVGGSKAKSIRMKIQIVPLFILFITVTIITVVASISSNSSLKKQMEKDGKMLARQIESQIEINYNATQIINSMLESKIRSSGHYILTNMDRLTNNYLIEIADKFGLDEINYIDNTGTIKYSNMPTNVNYVFDNTNIATSVIKGTTDFLMGDITKSNTSEDNYLYGYFGISGVGTVQVGILANNIQAIRDEVDTQYVMEQLAKDDGIAYAAFIDNNLTVTAHSDASKVGSSVKDIGSKTAAVEGKEYAATNQYNGDLDVYEVFVPVHQNDTVIGAIDLGISMDSVQTTTRNTIIMVIIISILIFAASFVILYIISRGIIRPLRQLMVSARKIEEGDFTYQCQVKSQDEIGILNQTFEQMKQGLRTTLRSIKQGADSVNMMSANLSMNARQMTKVSSEVTSATQEVSQGAESQANELVGVADNVHILVKELDSISNNLTSVMDNSSMTQDKAEIGKDQIDRLLSSIKEIRESFRVQADKIHNLINSVSKIGNVTNAIQEISSQTNLLALNAAIEAARAGEAGRGFSVVAEEVRKLAEQSQKATEEIQRLVESVRSDTSLVLDNTDMVNGLIESQSNTVSSTISAFDDMLKNLSLVGPLVNKTFTSLQSTIKSKDAIVLSVDSVTSVAQETSATSEEIAASSQESLTSAEEVSEYAEKLEKLSLELRQEIEKFNI